VVVLVLGECLDCGLVVDADVDSGVWVGRGGGDEVETFVYGV
jgi:hypothetical protein